MSKCWYCNEEILTGNNPEHIGICDKCYNDSFVEGNEFIGKLTNKISDLEAKLTEKDKLLNQYPYKNDVIEKQYDELKQCIEYLPTTEDKTQSSFIYSICHSVDVLCDKHKARIRDIENQICHIEQLEQQLAKKEEELREINSELIHQENYFADLKSFNNKRDYAKPIFEQMQKYLNHYKVKDKFKVYCSDCGKWEEYEFKDITFDEMTFDIYIQCKNCPRSLNTSNFPEQAIFWYKFIADLGALQRMQDYSLIESYQAQIGMLERHNQDKHEFAIAEINKTKEFIKENLEYMWNNNAEMTCRDRSIIDGIYKKIDEQIEELQEQEDE